MAGASPSRPILGAQDHAAGHVAHRLEAVDARIARATARSEHEPTRHVSFFADLTRSFSVDVRAGARRRNGVPMSADPFEQQYIDSFQKGSRGGRVERIAPARCQMFGRQMRFDLATGYRQLTTKKPNLKPSVYEQLGVPRQGQLALAAGGRGDDQGRVRRRNGEHGSVHGSPWRDWSGADGRAPGSQCRLYARSTGWNGRTGTDDDRAVSGHQ